MGIGEAGCSPPIHSLIADFYPERKRATALSIYSLGIPDRGRSWNLDWWLGGRVFWLENGFFGRRVSRDFACVDLFFNNVKEPPEAYSEPGGHSRRKRKSASETDSSIYVGS